MFSPTSRHGRSRIVSPPRNQPSVKKPLLGLNLAKPRGQTPCSSSVIGPMSNIPGTSSSELGQVFHMGEPWMTCKAYNGRCVGAWLADRSTVLASNHPYNHEFQLVAGCLKHGCLGGECEKVILESILEGSLINYLYLMPRTAGNDLLCHIERCGRYLSIPEKSTLFLVTRPQAPCCMIRSSQEAEKVLDCGLRYLNLYKALTRISLAP